MASSVEVGRQRERFGNVEESRIGSGCSYKSAGKQSVSRGQCKNSRGAERKLWRCRAFSKTGHGGRKETWR